MAKASRPPLDLARFSASRSRLSTAPSGALWLARKIVAANREIAAEVYRDELGETVGQALLRPHRSYQKIIAALRDLEGVHGFSHITGGGIVGNTKRLLPVGLKLEIDWNAWKWPPIFTLLQDYGNVATVEMRNVFNLGTGLVIIAERHALNTIKSILDELQVANWQIGGITHE